MPQATSLIATTSPPVPAIAAFEWVSNRSLMLGVRIRLKTFRAIESNIHARNAEASTSQRYLFSRVGSPSVTAVAGRSRDRSVVMIAPPQSTIDYDWFRGEQAPW